MKLMAGLAKTIKTLVAVDQMETMIKRLFISLTVLFVLSSNSFGQLEGAQASRLYNYIKGNFNNPDSIEYVAGLSLKELEITGIKGNHLYYAAVLIASANLEHSNNNKALRVINSVPIENISHLGTYYDVQLMKALSLKYNNLLLESDSLYTLMLVDIPHNMVSYRILALNNSAEVKELLGEFDHWKRNLIQAERLYELGKADLPYRRAGLYNKNIASHYLEVENIDSAFYYFSQIDTVGGTVLQKLSYTILESKILSEIKEYEASALSWQTAYQIALAYKYKDYYRQIALGVHRNETLQKKYIKERRGKMILYSLLVIIGFTTGFISTLRKRRFPNASSESLFRKMIGRRAKKSDWSSRLSDI